MTVAYRLGWNVVDQNVDLNHKHCVEFQKDAEIKY